MKKDLYETGSLTKAPQIAGMLGEFVAAWGIVEHSLRLALAQILSINIDTSEAILYALRNTASRIDILSEVINRGTHPRKEQLLDALGEVERMAGRRNSYLHCLIGVAPDGKVVRWDFRHPYESKPRRLSLTMNELEQLIFETTDTYNLLAVALDQPDQGPQPPWRSKYFQERAQSSNLGSRRRRKREKRRQRPPSPSRQ